MTIFLTGGSGFVGQNVLRRLLSRGHSVRCLVRPGAARRLPKSDTLTPVVDTLHDPCSFQDALRGCDAVIHLVGIISEVGENTFQRVHTYGTQHVVDAMRRSGVRRLVHMSALGTRPGAVSRYHRTKYDAEVYVQTFPEIEYTIFRPSVIHGPGAPFLRLLKRLALFPWYPFPRPVSSRMQPVHVDDVAELFVRALDTPGSVRRSFPVGGPQMFTVPEMVNVVAKALGRSPRYPILVPGPLAWFGAAVSEIVFPVLGVAPPLNTDQLILLAEDNICDRSESARVFGMTFTGFECALAGYIRQV